MANTSMVMRRMDPIGQHTGWFTAIGIIFIIAGAAAILMPFIASLAVAAAIGWVFFVVGIIQLIHAWQVRGWGGAIWQGIIGLIILLGGLAMIFDPVTAALTLTIILGVVFIVKGISQIIFGFNYRPHGGWGWILGAGVLSAIIGVLLLFAWPSSAIWALGTLAGISLIFTGWSYIALAMAAKRIVT